VIAMPVQRLIEVMGKLNDTHEELVGLAERKRDALIKNQVDEVSAITNKETRLMRMVGELLQEQQAATVDFFRTKGFQPTREVTVTELSRIVTDPKQKEALLAARDRLTEAIQILKKKNDLNQQLIEQSLEFINYSMNLVLGPDEEPTYKNPASRSYDTTKRSGFFDSRA